MTNYRMLSHMRLILWLKPIQELEQVAKRLMYEAYQVVQDQGDSSHIRCGSTLPWLDTKVWFSTRVEGEVQ
ncbi:hypothetical protein SO802_007842 [Lithocarpus litseifolius]|uniref:Uncharacterized protein n=1 Tax=Lithocarpus litseifolius TaxID=425828 RepID=A0AAW2DRI9_9ROSI